MPKFTITVVSNNIPNLARFLALWEEHGDHDDLVVMQDLDSKTSLGAPAEYCRTDCVAEGFGDIVSFGGCGTARSFAFHKAVERGADYVIALDDDCLPRPNDPPFCETYFSSMRRTRWDWLIQGIRTRGIPYGNAGVVQSVFHVGLWSGLADLDSIQLAAGVRSVPLPHGSRTIGKGLYFPWSVGNSCFHKSMLPLVLLPDMGASSPYLRYEDIWAGIILKKVADHLELTCSTGSPFVEHRSPDKSISRMQKEIAGFEVNEWFWEKIDKVKLNAASVAECGIEIANAMLQWDEPYFTDYARRIAAWINKVS